MAHARRSSAVDRQRVRRARLARTVDSVSEEREHRGESRRMRAKRFVSLDDPPLPPLVESVHDSSAGVLLASCEPRALNSRPRRASHLRPHAFAQSKSTRAVSAALDSSSTAPSPHGLLCCLIAMQRGTECVDRSRASSDNAAVDPSGLVRAANSLAI